MVVSFRRHTLLPLDDCLYALQPSIPQLTRSTLHRCLERHGISRLPSVDGDKPAKKSFKSYPSDREGDLRDYSFAVPSAIGCDMGMLRRAFLLLASFLPFGDRVAAQDRGTADRLAAIRTTVLDPAARFSVRAVLAELDTLETLTAVDSPDRGRVMQLRSFVENKGERAEDSIRHGEDALRIEAVHPFLSLDDKVSLRYSLARQAERLGRCGAAIPHYRAVLPLMAQNSVGPSGQLGTRQRLAFCLHEAGQFAEAQEINRAILAEATALFPADDPRTFTARMNLAQNNYALGDAAAARTVLQSLLADATAANDADMVDKSLFQLGVLAFEGKHRADALGFMERRLALARESGDPTRITAAKEDLDVLHNKLSASEKH